MSATLRGSPGRRRRPAPKCLRGVGCEFLALWFPRWGPARGPAGACGGDRERKPDCKDTSLTQPIALRGNRTAVKIYDVLDDRETQSHPPFAVGRDGGLP